MLNGENMDSFTALYALYLRFTFSTNLMHATPRCYDTFVFFSAFFYKCELFKFRVKDVMGTVDHAQNA